ncbi:MAG: hypothetical protein ACRCZY_02000 [Phocaeicola sp.]
MGVQKKAVLNLTLCVIQNSFYFIKPLCLPTILQPTQIRCIPWLSILADNSNGYHAYRVGMQRMV